MHMSGLLRKCACLTFIHVKHILINDLACPGKILAYKIKKIIRNFGLNGTKQQDHDPHDEMCKNM